MPVKDFVGIVIAIIHREDDIEDKWVVAAPGVKYSEKAIISAVDFQEKYFQYTIEVLK